MIEENVVTWFIRLPTDLQTIRLPPKMAHAREPKTGAAARFVRRSAALLVLLAAAGAVRADTEYYRHVFFDNSLTPDSYFYSAGKATAPSLLTLLDGKLPVESHTFRTPPNALRLEWTSRRGGGWAAQIEVVKFRNREIRFDGDVLSFWCFAPKRIDSANLPLVRIEDIEENLLRAASGWEVLRRSAKWQMGSSENPIARFHDGLDSAAGSKSPGQANLFAVFRRRGGPRLNP